MVLDVGHGGPALLSRLERNPRAIPGDLNCDGVVDFDDINPFVELLTGP